MRPGTAGCLLIAAVATLPAQAADPLRPATGLWYTAWWTKDDQFRHWSDCGVLPLRGPYEAGDPKVIAEQYAQFRDRYHPSTSSDAFFLSETGKRATSFTVRAHFKRICRRMSLPAGPSGRRPRLHDLRHTFACRRVLEWYREGTDVEHAMASLSTYLGHRQVTDTYWYLTGVPDLMTVAAKRLERFVRRGGAR